MCRLFATIIFSTLTIGPAARSGGPAARPAWLTRLYTCVSIKVMFLKRYNYYPVDTGGYVIMDDEFDVQLAKCANLRLVKDIVQSLNELDMEEPSEVTKIH